MRRVLVALLVVALTAAALFLAYIAVLWLWLIPAAFGVANDWKATAFGVSTAILASALAATALVVALRTRRSRHSTIAP